MFDANISLEKEKTLIKAKNDHKDRLLEIERENEMQSKQEILLSRLAAQTLEKRSGQKFRDMAMVPGRHEDSIMQGFPNPHESRFAPPPMNHEMLSKHK
jgi:hypothetical protein